MGDFFKPWRRKIGVATLLMACVLMAGWIRSPTGRDRLRFPIDTLNYHDIASFGGGLLWERVYLVQPIKLNAVESTYASALFSEFATTFVDTQMNLTSGIQEGGGQRFEWRWRCCGFDAGEIGEDGALGKFRGTFWFISYWSIVLPLTFISAFLLLTKPRQLTQKKTPEPTANDGM